MKKLILSAMLAAASVAFAIPSYAAGDVAAGKAKADDASCSDCHGDKGQGSGHNPAIAGMAPDKFTAAIAEFKSGKRKGNHMMEKAAKKLSDADAANLAAYYASLKK
jgi:cytochrome c553